MTEAQAKTFSNPERARAAGLKGGARVAASYGREYFQRIGKKGGERLKASREPDYYVKLGEKGAAARWKHRYEEPEE